MGYIKFKQVDTRDINCQKCKLSSLHYEEIMSEQPVQQKPELTE